MHRDDKRRRKPEAKQLGEGEGSRVNDDQKRRLDDNLQYLLENTRRFSQVQLQAAIRLALE